MTVSVLDQTLDVAEPVDVATPFQTLKARLQALGSVAHLVLDASLCGDVCAVLGDAVGLSAIPLDLPTIAYSDDSLTITGQATLWQEPATPITLVFADTEAGLQCTLTAGDLTGQAALRLQALVAHVLPDVQGLPDLALAQLAISVVPQARQVALRIAVQDGWEVPLGVTDIHVGDVQMTLTYAHDATPRLHAELSGNTTIANTAATVTATFGQEVALTCAIPRLDFAAIGQTFLPGVALPDGVPAITFADVELRVTPQDGGFSCHARSAEPWDSGLGGFSIAQTELAMSRTAGAVHGTLTVDGAGPVALGDDVRLETLHLAFDFAQSQHWSVAGSLRAVLYEHAFELAVNVNQAEAQTFNFTWKAADPVTLIDVTDLATLHLDALAFSIVRQATRNAWTLSSHGSLHVPHVIEHAAGSLEIEHNEARTGLAFLTEEGTISIALPLAASRTGEEVRFAATPRRLAIGRQQLAGELSKSFVFEAEADLAITGLETAVAHVLPAAPVSTIFRADKRGVSLRVAAVVEGVPLPIPVLDLADAKADLGTASLAVENLTLTLGRNLSLAADMTLDLPDEVNDLFGTANGQPRAPWINQHLECELGANTTTGFFFKILTPILRLGTVNSEDGMTHLDFGALGEVRYAPPVVSFDGINFAASGAFEQVRPLRLPLTLAQQLLRANTGTTPLADLLPDSLPLKTLRLLQRLPDGTLGLDETLLHQEFPMISADILDTIAARVGRLPAALRDYLQITIPDSFKFDIAITPGEGFGVRLDVETDAATPIRLLFPVPLPVPALVGITLRKLSFGEMFSGGLLLAEVDAVLHHFDLPTLVALLALPDKQFSMLPSSTAVGRQFTARNLFMPIVYEAGVPIPVPLFYDELGVEHLGLEGLGLGMKWHFPKPQGGITDVIALLKDMAPFFTKREVLLDPDIFDKHNLGLRFSIAPGFVQLPPYLGGNVLGSKGTLCSLALSQDFARMLNALKRPSLASLIPVAPLEQRTNASAIALGSMQLSAAWAVTTGDEFRNTLLAGGAGGASAFVRQVNALPAAERVALLDLTQPGRAQDGAVVLLIGDWLPTPAVHLNVRVGLAQSPTAGFGGGAMIAGSFGNLLAFKAGGAFVFDQPRQQFKLSGTNELRLAGRTVFSGRGEVVLAPDALLIDGDIDLFPGSRVLQVSGSGSLQLNGKGDLALHTAAKVVLAGFTLVNPTLDLTNDSLRLAGAWLGTSVTFAAQANGNGLMLRGQAGFAVDVPAFGPVTLKGRKVADSLSLGAAVGVGLAVTLSPSGSGFSARASVRNARWQGNTLTVPDFTLSVPFDSVRALGQRVAEQMRTNAEAIFQSAFTNATTWFDAVRNGVIRFTGTVLDRALVLRDVFRLTDATSVIPLLLRDPQYTWQDMGNVLRTVFGVSEVSAVIAVLRDARINAGWNAVALVLRDVYGVQDPTAVLQVLRRAGAGWSDAGKVLRDVFGKDRTDAAKLLAAPPFTVPWNDLGAVLRDVYSLDPTTIARVLARCGIQWINLARVLVDVLQITDPAAVARILYDIGASKGSLQTVLTEYFSLRWDGIVKILRALFG